MFLYKSFLKRIREHDVQRLCRHKQLNRTFIISQEPFQAEEVHTLLMNASQQFSPLSLLLCFVSLEYLANALHKLVRCKDSPSQKTLRQLQSRGKMVLTKLTGLLTLLFISATRPFTRSLGKKGVRSGTARQSVGVLKACTNPSQTKQNPIEN